MDLLKSQFQSSYYSATQCATGLKLYYVIPCQKLDESHTERFNCNTFEDI